MEQLESTNKIESIVEEDVEWWENEILIQNKLNTTLRVKITEPRKYLLNVTAASLLEEINYFSSSDKKVDIILNALIKCAEKYPEFICQLAVYIRNQLYIRTTTNFIVAFCLVNKHTKPFIEKYFKKAVLIPQDLLQVCEYAQIIGYIDVYYFSSYVLSCNKIKDIRRNLKFPRNLQRCVREKFIQFSDYQMGKYCTDSQRKKTLKNYQMQIDPEKWFSMLEKKKKRLQNKNQEQIEKKEQKAQKAMKKHRKIIRKQPKTKQQMIAERFKQNFLSDFLTFKDLVQFCHIKNPKNRVQAILGAKYPKTEEEFQQKKLFDGEFDPSKAGQRMKIPISMTWESELSAKGNNAEVWEALIKQNKIPYLALLRNIRNILQAGVNDECHYQLIDKIKNPQAVQGAKIFPLQYFSAFEIVNESIEKGFKKQNQKLKDQIEYVKKVNADETKLIEKMQLEEENQDLDQYVRVNTEIGKLYIESLNEAVKISVNNNLDTIKGHTAIFADVSASMKAPMSQGKKGYGSIRNCMECALVLGLMIKQKCENTSFYVFSSPGIEHQQCHLQVEVPQGNLLEQMKVLMQEKDKLGGGTDFPYECINSWKENNIHVDNIIILSDMMISEGYNDIASRGYSVNKTLNEYRLSVNQNVKIFCVDLKGTGQSVNLGQEFDDNNYVKIFGMNNSILKFISQKSGNIDQIEEVIKYANQQIQ